MIRKQKLGAWQYVKLLSRFLLQNEIPIVNKHVGTLLFLVEER